MSKSRRTRRSAKLASRGKGSPRDAKAPGTAPPARAGILVPAGIFILALGVRLVYLVDSADYPAFAVPIVDALEYDQHAREFAVGRGLSKQFFWQPFFYPFFLGLVYSVNGGSVVGVKVLQAVLGAVTCALTCRLGERLFGRATGIIAGGITALYGPLIFYESELLATGWAAFWSVVLILLLLEARARQNVWLCLALGACGGLSVLTRPTFLPFFLAAGVWLGWGLLTAATGWRLRIARCAAAVAGFALLTTPVAVQSYRVTEKFTFLPSSGGINVYLGNHPETCRMATIAVGFEWDQLTGLPLRAGHTEMWSQQQYFYDQTRAYVLDDPLGFARRLARKALQFASSREIPRNVDVYVARQWSVLQSLLTWKALGFGFPYGVLLPLAVVGLARRWRNVSVPLMLYVIFYPLAIVLVFVTARYRVPMAPVLAILAAAGCVATTRLFTTRQCRQLALAGGGGIAVALLGSLTGPFCEEQQIFEAGLHANIGYYHLRSGNKPAALDCYQQAIRLDPDLAEAQCNVGNLLAEEGRLNEALTHYEIALRTKPHLAGIHNSHGAALLNLGRPAEAAASFRQAMRLDPTLARARMNLGIALMRLGRLEEAVAEHREAVRLDPRNAMGHYNLGVALGQLGDHAAAIAAYRAALRLSPSDIRILYGLGFALESAGRLEEAVKHYQAVLRIDPRYLDASQRLKRLTQRRQPP